MQPRNATESFRLSQRIHQLDAQIAALQAERDKLWGEYERAFDRPIEPRTGRIAATQKPAAARVAVERPGEEPQPHRSPRKGNTPTVVMNFMREHRTKPFGTGEVARALNLPGKRVSTVLNRLAAKGELHRVGEKFKAPEVNLVSA